jgi:raffinose/stachyose/melibiose transport system substrate-binding protein
LSTSFDDSAIALSEGSAVHTFSRTNIVGTIKNVAPDKIDDIGFFPLPDENPNVRGAALWLTQSWCISKNTKNADLALALLDFMVSDEGLQAFCSGTSPTGVFAIKGSTLSNDVVEVIKEAQAWVNKDPQLVMEYFCDIKGSNMSTILSMVGTCQIDPAEAVKEIEVDNAIDAQQKGIPGW